MNRGQFFAIGAARIKMPGGIQVQAIKAKLSRQEIPSECNALYMEGFSDLPDGCFFIIPGIRTAHLERLGSDPSLRSRPFMEIYALWPQSARIKT